MQSRSDRIAVGARSTAGTTEADEPTGLPFARFRARTALAWSQLPRLGVRTVLTWTMLFDTVPTVANGSGVPEKVAWILVRDGRVLVTRSHGRDHFYLPGGHREPGESDGETLVREIDEELRTAVDPGSMVHFGTFEIGEGHPDHDPFRMICYTADHRGELIPSREIAQKAWFRHADRHRVSAVDGMVFDALHTAGRLC